MFSDNRFRTETRVKRAYAVANAIETEFFQRHFGYNKDIHTFVRSALLEGRRDVAQEVNRAIKILGTPDEPDGFIRRVRDTMKYAPSSPSYPDRPALPVLMVLVLMVAAFVGFKFNHLGSRRRQ
jgi:hypothetical protein